MSLVRQALENTYVAARCLLAFQRGDESPAALAGAMLHAKQIGYLRCIFHALGGED